MQVRQGLLDMLLATMILGFAGALPGSAHAACAADNYQKLCVNCHGQDGSGNGPVAAVLEKHPADFSDCAFMKTQSRDFLVKIITDGGTSVDKSPQMPAHSKKLSAEEIDGLVDYVRSEFCKEK